jgi:hypothetical protein
MVTVLAFSNLDPEYVGTLCSSASFPDSGM